MSLRDLLVLAAGTFLGIVAGLLAVGLAGLVGGGGISGLPIVVLLIMFSVPLALYIAVKKREVRKRVDATAAAGFVPSDIADDDLRRKLSVFPMFSQPSGRISKNRFRLCAEGVETLVFDYSYVSVPRIGFWLLLVPKAGATAVRYRSQTVLLCEREDVIFPQFSLRLRTAVRQETQEFEDSASEDVLIPSEFSKKYALRGFEVQRIRALFTREVVSYCMAHRGLQADGAGRVLAVYRSGRNVAGGQLAEFVEEAVGLLNLLKAASRS